MISIKMKSSKHRMKWYYVAKSLLFLNFIVDKEISNKKLFEVLSTIRIPIITHKEHEKWLNEFLKILQSKVNINFTLLKCHEYYYHFWKEIEIFKEKFPLISQINSFLIRKILEHLKYKQSLMQDPNSDIGINLDHVYIRSYMSQSHDQEYKLFQFFAQKHCIDLTQIDEELYRLKDSILEEDLPFTQRTRFSILAQGLHRQETLGESDKPINSSRVINESIKAKTYSIEEANNQSRYKGSKRFFSVYDDYDENIFNSYTSIYSSEYKKSICKTSCGKTPEMNKKPLIDPRLKLRLSIYGMNFQQKNSKEDSLSLKRVDFNANTFNTFNNVFKFN